MKGTRTTSNAIAAMLALLLGMPVYGTTEVADQASRGPKLPPPANGHGRYVMMLWDPGTPVPGSDGKELMNDVPEPELEKLGGKLLARHGRKRVLDLPPGKAKELRKHRSVMYLQRVWMGEPLEELAEEPETASAAMVASHSDTGLAWGPKVYSYDPSGNIKEIAKKDAGGNSISADSYAYDTAGRLITATVAGKTEQYEYDAYGNLTRKTLVGSSSVTIPVDPSTNRLVGMEYDSAGNVLRRDSDVVQKGTYTYDAFNMLSSFSPNARRYLYDANDERIGMIDASSERSQWTIRDVEGRVLREYAGAPEQDEQTWVWQQDYVYAGSQLVGGERMRWGYLEDRMGGPRHYHLDHLGSVRLVTDEDARAVSEDDYYPFGTAATKSFQEPLNWAHFVDGARYAGHHRDYLAWTSFETGEYLDYMHARYYDPKLGRFLSVDPKGASAKPGLPQTWNRYAYARNNPLKYIDPDGQDVYIVVTNTVVDDTRVNSRPGGAGMNETVPAYKIVMMSEAGYVDTFAGSRDTNYSGKTMNTRGAYGSNHEAPPGTYFGKIRTDGKLGPRVELSDKKGGSTIAGPDGTRSNIQIHVGPGCSQGCVLLTGGKSNRDAFINSVEFMQEEERAAGRSDQIHVIVQPRNKQECSGDRCELNPK
jgi:RHS repeat-associated protein